MRRSWIPIAALLSFAALTTAAAAFIVSSARSREAARFDRAVATTQDRIEARLETYAALLRATSAVFHAHPDVTAEEFRAYVEQLGLRSRFQGVQGIAWARRLHRPESARLAAERAEESPGFRIWPDAGREERVAIWLIEPQDLRNRAALGFDMMTDPVRREAMERARDTAEAALSGRVTLVQEIDEKSRQPGFLLYLPVYRGGGAPATIEGRREQCLGFVAAPFRADDFFHGIFGREASPVADFAVYDGQPEPATLLHARSELTSGPERLQAMPLFGRTWTVAFAQLRSGRDPLDAAALAVFLLGAAFSATLFFVQREQLRARTVAEANAASLAVAERLAREEARQSDTLRRLGSALSAELDLDRLAQHVTDEATALIGAETGSLFHTPGAGGEFKLFALSGKYQEQYRKMAMPRSTPIFGPVLRGERAMRFDDVHAAADYGKNAPHHGLPEGHPPVRSFLAAPVLSRTGAVLGSFFFAHAEPGKFTADHERLVVAIAAHAAIAMDNARLYRALTEADRKKDEFLAILGHELRNPLAPILTALELMRNDPASAPRHTAVLERQARHLAHLVDDLLDVSRISRGKIELRKKSVGVRDALLRAVDAVRPMAEARGHTLRVHPPARPLLLDADPVRLEQILNNLLTNAIKYSQRGGTIDLSAEAREGKQLEIRVRDTGIGIPPDALRVLFEPFVQVPGAKDYATGGLGIGLALVKGLVELHGGTVEARSEGLGHGAEFVVRLPRVLGEGLTPPAGIQRVARRTSAGKVLIVDDNVDAAETLAEVFRLGGHDAHVAHSGPDAIAAARTFDADLVLLDIGLGLMTGYDVLPLLRELPTLKGARIVALTGFGQESDRRRALDAGFDDHLVKPVDLDRVTSLLTDRLQEAQA